MLIAALSGISAARVPGAGMCIPLLMQCGSAQPSPAPTPTSTLAPAPGSIPTFPAIPIPGGIGSAPAAPGSSVVGAPDTEAPIFTLPAAQLGGSSISISGLHSVSVVTVPLADGTRTTALKIVADGVTVEDFLLDVRKATGPSLVTNATRMQLRGAVTVYLDSLTATLLDGTALALGAATPPPGNELPPTMLRVNLGLVGVTANSIAFTAPHQSLK